MINVEQTIGNMADKSANAPQRDVFYSDFHSDDFNIE